MKTSHGCHQDIWEVASHIFTQQSEGRYPLVHFTAGQRHQLQFGESVQGLLQLTTMEEVKEGGKVEEEEEGGCRVPCGVALTSMP